MKNRSTILVVNGSTESLALIADTLETAGFAVSAADSSELTRASLAAKSAELILQVQTNELQGQDAPLYLQSLLDLSLNEIYVFNAELLRFIHVSKSALANLGFTLEQMRNMTPLDLMPEYSSATFLELIKPLEQKTKDKLSFETSHRRGDGSLYPLEVQLTLVESADSRCFFAMADDISERKQTEIQLRKANRSCSLLSSINNTIVRVHEPQELFEATCRIAVEQGGFCMAWIGLLDPQTKQVLPVAHAGRTDDYLEKLNITVSDSERGHGPTASALRSGKSIVVNNIANDPRMAPWLADAQRLGYHSSAALPLIVAGTVRGALSLYASEADFFDADELKLFDEMAANIAFALEFSEHEKERRQMEESLQEQKKFTEKLIENSAAATFVLDSQHKVILWNRACEELTGLTAAALIGTDDHWQAFYDHKRPCLCDIVLDAGDDGLPGLYSSFAKSTLIPDGLHAEGWYKNLHARDRYILFDAAPIYDDRGNLLAAIETLNDVTEQKRADEAIRLQSAALQAAGNAIVITDKSGSIEWVNPAFTALTGYSPEEVTRTNPRELLKSGVHGEGFYKRLWDNILEGEIWCGEITNRHKNGTLYPEEQTITPVKDASGEITHFIAIKRDLSEHRKLEALLNQSQKMESIGTLAGGIAHDFNNILAAIIGYGQFTLMQMSTADPLRHNIDSMLEAADRAARLTQELLLFSRKQPIDRKPLDLNLVVAKVEKFLKTVIGEDIFYQTNLHEAQLPVFADEYQLEQVLMNLATNARDSMPQGGSFTVTTAHVTLNGEFVSAHGYGKPGAYALITAADTGIGMDEATQQRIFEPFFTTKEVGKGTGLGLAVTYGIIKQHDAYISVQSQPGAGTTFSIYLPLIAAEVEEDSLLVPQRSVAGGTETILLAEDDDAVRVMTKKLLTEFGYTVIAAVDGADAVSRFAENGQSIDLLLFDLIMPKMNGKEAFDEIRRLRPKIKALFYSGYAPETIRQKTSLAEGTQLMAKPASPLEVLRNVRSVLDGEPIN